MLAKTPTFLRKKLIYLYNVNDHYYIGYNEVYCYAPTEKFNNLIVTLPHPSVVLP